MQFFFCRNCTGFLRQLRQLSSFFSKINFDTLLFNSTLSKLGLRNYKMIPVATGLALNTFPETMNRIYMY